MESCPVSVQNGHLSPVRRGREQHTQEPQLKTYKSIQMAPQKLPDIPSLQPPATSTDEEWEEATFQPVGDDHPDISIDWPRAVANHHGERKLRAFLAEYPNDLSRLAMQLQEALTSDDANQLQEAAHQVKGSSSYVAATKLHTNAVNLVEAIELETGEQVPELARLTACEAVRLETELRRLQHFLGVETVNIELSKSIPVSKSSVTSFALTKSLRSSWPAESFSSLGYIGGADSTTPTATAIPPVAPPESSKASLKQACCIVQ